MAGWRSGKTGIM